MILYFHLTILQNLNNIFNNLNKLALQALKMASFLFSYPLKVYKLPKKGNVTKKLIL